MNDDTVKLIRIPADTWRAVVASLEAQVRRCEERRVYWMQGLCDDIAREFEYVGNEAKDALELARKVEA